MKAIFAIMALSVSTTAFATCYQIYAPSNELVWQGTSAPVPMDTASLDKEVQKMVPKGHMVIISNTTPCPAVDLTKRTTLRQKVEAMKND